MSKNTIWTTQVNLEVLNSFSEKTLVKNLAIRFTEVGEDYLKATMPVDEKTVQPMRLLHGGASVALAETMGSMASMLCLENPNTHSVVGVEINASHLSSAKEGDTVTAIVKPIRIGRSLHVWEIKIYRSDKRLICVSRLTIAVVKNRP